MMRQIAVLFALMLLAGPVRAILPPDAKAREPQLRAQHLRAQQQYEERMVARRAEAVRAYEKTQADIFTPPWMRTETGGARLSGADSSAVAAAEKTEKRNHRFLVSIVLLILTGVAAGAVRYATRKPGE